MNLGDQRHYLHGSEANRFFWHMPVSQRTLISTIFYGSAFFVEAALERFKRRVLAKKMIGWKIIRLKIWFSNYRHVNSRFHSWLGPFFNPSRMYGASLQERGSLLVSDTRTETSGL